MKKENNNETKKYTSSLENLTLEDLLQYERTSSIVCKKYENSCKSYDGSISNSEEYTMFLKYNNFHEEIISEMQKRLDIFID